MTEPNPNLVAPAGARDVPEPWARWRDALGAVRPRLYRLVVDWASVQPSAGAPADMAAPNGGCMRTLQPCLGWAGVRDQLRALAARQREGGWQGVVVITDTPGWAAAAPSGCERPGTGPRSRAPRPDALPAYRALAAAVLATAREEGADLRWWSPWNEPNHPYFLSPQRTACGRDAPTAAVGPYVALARALQEELAAQPGDQRLVLGELAGIRRRTRDATEVGEFIAALPGDLVCAAPVWAQHAYVGGRDPAPGVAAALRAHGCAAAREIWITETGVGPASSDLAAARTRDADAAGCLALHRRLERWWREPQVTAAFQYTLREDDRFPTGLVTTDLAASRPTLGEWTAWGGDRAPADPPPAPACSA